MEEKQIENRGKTQTEGLLLGPKMPLTGVKELVRETFALIRENKGRFFGVMTVPPIVAIVSLFTSHISLPWFVWMFVHLVPFFFFIISLPAFLYIVKDSSTSVLSAYRKAFPSFFSYLWIMMLGCFIVAGGIPFFIVPAFILGMWSIFVLYTRFFEDDRGLAAFTKSREYIRGRFWEIAERLLAVYLPVILAIIILNMIFRVFFDLSGVAEETSKDSIYILNHLIQICVGPFLLGYIYFLYKNIKKLHPEIVEQDIQKGRNAFVLFGILGIFVNSYAILATFMVPVGPRSPSLDYRRLGEVAYISSYLQMYMNQCNHYPGVSDTIEICNSESSDWKSVEQTLKETLEGRSFYYGPYFYGVDKDGFRCVVGFTVEDSKMFKSKLKEDVDGVVYGVDCNDPVYCEDF